MKNIKLNIQKFANMSVGDVYTSPTINIKPYGYSSDAYALKFTVTLNSQDAIGGTSNITIESFMKTLGNAWGWINFRNIYLERYIKVNDEINYTLMNTTQINTLPTNNSGNWVSCGSWTGNIGHRPNGECELYVMNHLSTSSYSSTDFIPRDTELESEELNLEPLHKPPYNIQYTITELNQDLIDAGIDDEVFVKDLSIKQFDITADFYDDATYEYSRIFNYLYFKQSEDNPQRVTYNFKENVLQFGDNIEEPNKIPIRLGVVDTLGAGAILNNPDNIYGYFLYDGIKYNKITLNDTNVTVKRIGQISGRVALNVAGNYYNGIVGNKNQGENYKPTIQYKFWKLGDSEPATYDYTIPSGNISIDNSTFSVNNYDIGSSVESAVNYFNPDYAYRIKVRVNDYFTNDISSEKSIFVGEAVWTEYKDHVDFKALTIGGQPISAGGIEKTLLWQNPNPSETFTAQNVYLSSSDYDELEIWFLEAKNGNVYYTQKIRKGSHTRLMDYFLPTDARFVCDSRYMQYISDTQYYFETARRFTINNSGGQSAVNENLVAHPMYIYGIKY